MSMFDWGMQHQDDIEWWVCMDDERRLQEMRADEEYDVIGGEEE